jgi:diguanylate cyclase (GGDEF)-like protein
MERGLPLTDETQAADLWQTDLSEIFERPHMRLEEVDESLRTLNAAREDLEVYRNYFYVLAHLEFDEAAAFKHWEEFRKYHAKFEEDLGYPIDTRITTLSYFMNENRQLENPKIIEMKVFQRTQEKVVLDDLTSLFNFRYFKQRIQAEMEGAASRSEQLSLLIIDIDNFKHINDDYGHLTGDGILRQIGKLIQAETSAHGPAFRYGGEEFTVIVPRVDKQQAYDLANKLCERISEHEFLNENSTPRHKMSVTASLGVATYPQDCDDSQLLIGNADKALYNAKGSGKNIVCLFSENQRRFKRLSTSIRGELANFSQSTTSIRTLNVSRGGIRFICGDDLPREAIVKVRLALEAKKEPIVLLCRIINKDSDVDSFVYGTEIASISTRDRSRFNRLVDSLTGT